MARRSPNSGNRLYYLVKFEGEEDIGMVVGSADTKNIVVEVIDGMAADRAGIQVGDELRKYSMDPRVKMKDGLPFKDDSMPFINGLPPGKVIRIQVNTSSSDSDAYKSRSKHIRRVMKRTRDENGCEFYKQIHDYDFKKRMTHTKQAEVDSHNKDRADAVLHEDDVNKHDQEDDDEELRDQEHANAVLHLDDMDEHVHEEADVSRRDQEHADADLHEDALAVHRPDQDEASLHDQDHDDSDSHDPEQVATLYDQDQSDPILHNQEQDEADFKEDDVTLCDAAVATWMKDTNQSNAVRNDEGQDVDAHETDADLRVAESYHGYEPNHEDCIDERFVNHHRGCYGVISDSEAESLCRSDLRDIESGCVVRMYQYGRPSELCRIRSGCIDRINRGGQFDRDTVRVFCLQSIGLLGYEEIKFISSLETCWPLGSGVVILPILYQSYWYLIATVHEDSENATMYIFNNVTKDFSGSTIDDVKKMIEDAGMHVSIKYAKIKTFGGPALQKQIDDSGLFVVNAVQSIVEIIGFDTDKKICEKIDAQQFKISRSRQQLSKEIEELVANKVLRCDIFWAFYECKEKAGVFVWPCYKLSKSFAHKMDDDHKSNDVAVVWFKRTKGYSLCDWLSNNSLASITALSLDEVIANYYGGDAVDGLIDAYNSAQSNIGA